MKRPEDHKSMGAAIKANLYDDLLIGFSVIADLLNV